MIFEFKKKRIINREISFRNATLLEDFNETKKNNFLKAHLGFEQIVMDFFNLKNTKKE